MGSGKYSNAEAGVFDQTGSDMNWETCLPQFVVSVAGCGKITSGNWASIISRRHERGNLLIGHSVMSFVFIRQWTRSKSMLTMHLRHQKCIGRQQWRASHNARQLNTYIFPKTKVRLCKKLAGVQFLDLFICCCCCRDCCLTLRVSL